MAASITREIAHLNGLEVVLETERAAAERGLAAAQTEQQKATKLFDSLQQEITAKRAALESKTFGWVDLFGIGGYIAVVAIISLATGGGAAAVAGAYLPQILSTLTDGGGMPFKEADRAAALNAALGLKGLLGKDGKPDPLGPMLLSLSKLLSDINESDGDAELKAMLRKSVELTFDKLISARRVEQAALSLAATDLRLQQARIDRELAQAQLDGLTADVDYLEQVALTLIRSAQGYMDILMRYAFLAARSVEIYTIDDLSNEVFYDYGYVHPDLEQDYTDGLLPLAQLIGAYVTSWSRFVGVIGYRSRYDAYFASTDRVSDKVFLSVTDPAALADFRATQTLAVEVRLDDLPSTRFEAKATYVLLALAGATANIPAISALVEHGGEASSTMRDGTAAGPAPAAAHHRRADRQGGRCLRRRARRGRSRQSQLLGPRCRDDVAGHDRGRGDDAPPGRPVRPDRDRHRDRLRRLLVSRIQGRRGRCHTDGLPLDGLSARSPTPPPTMKVLHPAPVGTALSCTVLPATGSRKPAMAQGR